MKQKDVKKLGRRSKKTIGTNHVVTAKGENTTHAPRRYCNEKKIKKANTGMKEDQPSKNTTQDELF